MSGLGRRLDALEQIAEECRRHERRDYLRDTITRSYSAGGVVLMPEQLDTKVARADTLADHMALLASHGLTLSEIARRVAFEHELPPDRVLSIFERLRSERGRPI